jgi:hypothetical protein
MNTKSHVLERLEAAYMLGQMDGVEFSRRCNYLYELGLF